MLVALAAAAEEESRREKRQIVFGNTGFGSPSPPTRGTPYAVSHGSFVLGAAPSYSVNANPYVDYAWSGFSSPLRVPYQPAQYAQPALSYPQPESRPAAYEYGVKIAHQAVVAYAPATPQDSYGPPCK